MMLLHEIPQKEMKENFRDTLSQLEYPFSEEILEQMCMYAYRHSIYCSQLGFQVLWYNGLPQHILLRFYRLTNSPQEQFLRILELTDVDSISHSWELCEKSFQARLKLSSIPTENIEQMEGWFNLYKPKHPEFYQNTWTWVSKIPKLFSNRTRIYL